jgi:leader peptidase (prepilin peptidase)/N-methyltransferase
MTGFTAVACGVLGLAVGSFLNVVIHRVPRGESVVRPRSRCPGCEAPIAARDNVPVLSYVALRARCRACGTLIPLRYPTVEVLTAGLFAAMALRFGPSAELPAYLVLTAALVALSVIDLDTFLLPNVITYPLAGALLALLGVAAAVRADPGAWVRAVAGGAAAFGFFLVVHLISPRGMGFGDVKLSFSLGAALGWLSGGHVFVGLFLGFLLGALVGMALIVAGRRSRRQHIPFGPFLAAGTILGVLAGDPLLDLWLRR